MKADARKGSGEVEMNKNVFISCLVLLVSILAIFLYVDSKIDYFKEYLLPLAYLIIVGEIVSLISYQLYVHKYKEKKREKR